MKKSIWISITTLMLCLGVMAFGVYSAISANLNITGNLGFNIHDCVVGVSGTIYNLSEMDADGTSARLYDKTLGTTIMGGESTTTSTISLGDMYFYHGAYVDPETKIATVKTYDIVFQITITNLSESAITANIPAPTLGNTSAITMLDADDNAEYTSFPYEGKIAKNSQKTIMFALRLTDKTALTEKVVFDWENISFEESESLYGIDSKGRLYVYMGEDSSGISLKWYAIARDNSGTFETLKSTEFTNVETGTYVFISECILDYSDDDPYMAFTSAANTVMSSSNNYGANYNGSTVQTFVNDKETDSLYERYKLGDLKYAEIYNNILPYDCEEETIIDTDTKKELTCPATNDQTLWLLSYAQYTTWFGDGDSSGIGNLLSTNSASCWWLRSPESADSDINASSVRYVDGSGNVKTCAATYRVICSARPAFQIIIT